MNILQIGVCNSTVEDEVSYLIKKYSKFIENVTFIDANPNSMNLCSNFYKNNFIEIYNKLNFINAAIVESNYNEEFIKFYKPSKYELAGYESLIKEHVVTHLKYENRDTSITELNIKAIKINDILNSGIFYDRLYIDVEGYDCKIIQSIDFEKFYIPFIFFEHKHSDGTFSQGEILKNTLNILSKNSYKIFKYDEYNLVCIK